MTAPLTRTADTGAIITRFAPGTASTFDAETRTVEVVFSTGAPVTRYDMEGAYIERLDLNQNWPSTLPVLDSHRRDSLNDQLGSADSLVSVGEGARAIVRLSRHNPLADRIAAELAEGRRFGVSCGYTVQRYQTSTDAQGRRVKTATQWTPIEISLVIIPADAAATTRELPMPAPLDTTATSPNEETAATDRADATTTTTAAPERASVNQQIRSVAEIAGLTRAWADGQIDAGATLEQARAAAMAEIETRSAATSSIRATRAEVIGERDEPMIRAAAMGEAMFTRINPTHQPSERAREFIGLSIAELARSSLHAVGIRTTGLAAGTVIERALHTTSDFPLALGETTGRELRAAYAQAGPALRRAARKTTARDFRAKSLIKLSSAPTLLPVNEAGEFTSGTMAEAKEGYSVSTFGRIIGLSRQILVNDDLGAFRDLARPMGQAAAAFEEKFLADLLTTASGAGPTMQDSVALFHASHGNLAASGAAITINSLSAARVAMRRQKGLAAEVISIEPRFLIVSPEKETEAEQILSAIAAAKQTDVNPLRTLELIVDPRLPVGNAWYIAADPAAFDGLEYAHLEGAEGPQIVTENGFDVDGVRVRVRLDFGAGFADWRGWYRNPGA